MGAIDQFQIDNLITHYGCRTFVETGTGSGVSLHYAMRFPFAALHSCEYDSDLAKAAGILFQDDPRVTIHAAKSEDMLHQLLPQLATDKSAAFWLDAHFPGADYAGRAYDAETDFDLRLPLERELTLIRDARPQGGDVIMIDDLRIYEDGPFAHGPCPPHHCNLPPAMRNIDFVFRLFGETHSITRFYQSEGYLALTPKRVALKPSVAEALPYALAFQQDNRQKDCVRVLEQILWLNMGDSRVAGYVTATVVKTAQQTPSLLPLIEPWQILLQLAGRNGWTSCAVFLPRLYGGLLHELAPSQNMVISCFVDTQPQIFNRRFLDITVVTPAEAIQNGIRQFLVATIDAEARCRNAILNAARQQGCEVAIMGPSDIVTLVQQRVRT